MQNTPPRKFGSDLSVNRLAIRSGALQVAGPGRAVRSAPVQSPGTSGSSGQRPCYQKPCGDAKCMKPILDHVCRLSFGHPS